MLPRTRRLVREQDYRRVYQRGVHYSTPTLVLKVLRVPTPFRVGFVVSQKVAKKANKRNEIKRQIREAVRLRLNMFSEGWDCVFIARNSYDIDKRQENLHNIDFLLRKAGVIQKSAKIS